MLAVSCCFSNVQRTRNFATLILLVPLLLSGCLAGPRSAALSSQGKYPEVIADVERKARAAEKFGVGDLYFLCDAYSKLKKFEKVFECTDRLQKRVRAGEYIIALGNGFDIRYGPDYFRALAYLDLDDDRRAISHAELAVEITRQDKNPSFRIDALSLLGLAYSNAGKPLKARQAAVELEAISTDYPYNLMSEPKSTGLAMIYLSLGDVASAGKWAKSSSSGIASSVKFTAQQIIGSAAMSPYELPKQFAGAKYHLLAKDLPRAKVAFDKLLSLPNESDPISLDTELA